MNGSCLVRATMCLLSLPKTNRDFPMASWYLELAESENLNPKSVLLALGKAVQAKLAEDRNSAHMGKPWVSLDVPLLSVTEVARLLNVSEETVRRYARSGVLTTVDFPGGSIRFDAKVLIQEINSYVRPSKFST